MKSFIQLAESVVTPLIFLALFTAIYIFFLPRPIPGIPCNPSALKTPLGDVPSIMRCVPSPGFATWLVGQPQKHQSPIVQIFFKPFQRRPAIILADYREARHLLTHRTNDFDRSAYSGRVFGGLVPDHHVTMPTGDKWKSRRRLLQDTMSPSFLRSVVAEVIYGKATELIRLWEIKSDIAEGKPFNARADISQAAMDSVLGFSFGREFPSATIPNIEHLESLDKEAIRGIRSTSRTATEPMTFPTIDLGEEVTATAKLAMSVEKMIGSISPEWKWWIMQRTTMRKSLAIRDAYIDRELDRAVSRLGNPDDDTWVRSALDHIIARVNRAADRAGREPEFFTDDIRVEIFGFTVAGFETTATTLQWTMKLLSDNPHVQTKLRDSLRTAWPDALAEGRLPNVAELHGPSVPYLDAAIEESLRCAVTVNNAARDAIRDTTLLGHPIRKGTTIFVLQHGPGVLSPVFPIEHSRRGAGSGGENPPDQEKLGEWDPENMAEYNPDRWLIPSRRSQGEMEFDPNAGPNQPFSLGLRSCFGKRVAYIQLKTIVALTVWRFVLERCPDELSGYGAADGVSHRPTQCYVSLKPAY